MLRFQKRSGLQNIRLRGLPPTPMTLTNSPRLLALILAVALPTLVLRWRRWRRRRVSKLAPNEERVLVLGATR